MYLETEQKEQKTLMKIIIEMYPLHNSFHCKIPLEVATMGRYLRN